MNVDQHPLVIRRREFYSKWYGALTRADNYIYPCVGAAVIDIGLSIYAFQSAPVFAVIGWVGIGFAWGTLYEYLNHRYLFHEWVKVPGLRGFENVHLPHHVDLKDGINAGPFSYLPVLGVWWVLMFFTVGPAWASAFIIGMSFWFMWYEYQHDMDHREAHELHLSESGLVQRMRSYHDYHHRYPEKNFCITSPFWDHVFGTKV